MAGKKDGGGKKRKARVRKKLEVKDLDAKAGGSVKGSGIIATSGLGTVGTVGAVGPCFRPLMQKGAIGPCERPRL